jgi:hypothetical protein
LNAIANIARQCHRASFPSWPLASKIAAPGSELGGYGCDPYSPKLPAAVRHRASRPVGHGGGDMVFVRKTD